MTATIPNPKDFLRKSPVMRKYSIDELFEKEEVSPHSLDIDDLIAKITPVDFAGVLGEVNMEDDWDSRVLTLIIEKMMDVVSSEGWELYIDEERRICFKGNRVLTAMDKIHTSPNVNRLLTRVAEKMGVNKYRARSFKFAFGLVMQLCHVIEMGSL